jgi:hypothetical protein
LKYLILLAIVVAVLWLAKLGRRDRRGDKESGPSNATSQNANAPEK